MATVSLTTSTGVATHTLSTGARGPAASVNATTVAAAGGVVIDPTSTVMVDASGTDAERGTALLAAYAAAKLLLPNGAALSATNRATVILPPGKYKVTSTLTLDTSFIDICGLVTAAIERSATDSDSYTSAADASNFRPPPAYVYCNTDLVTTVVQAAADIRLSDFGIAYLHDDAESVVNDVAHAFYCNLTDATGNAASNYTRMYFFNQIALPQGDTGEFRAPVGFAKHVRGTWNGCVANAFAWRVGTNGEFSPTMTECVAGGFSFAGDRTGGAVVGCRLIRCRGEGLVQFGTSTGFACFSGCTGFGINIDVNSYFIDCEGGNNCFGIGAVNSGNFIRCRGGKYCFGGSFSLESTFAGYAEDCVALEGSFGSSNTVNMGKLTGTLVRCRSTGGIRPWRCEGAQVYDSWLEVTNTGIHCVQLLDSNTTILRSHLRVIQGGTGYPVFASSGFMIGYVSGTTMNNATRSATGFDETNSANGIASANNTVSDFLRMFGL